jgi:hypothetical protein
MSGSGGEGLIKAVVVTRGRTGSSAITQELGMVAGARSEQEVFSAGPDLRYYDFPPFNEWRRQREDEPDEEALANAYLDALERDAVARGCRVLFWKALSHHFDERPYLGVTLQRRGYRAVYLRRSPVRQVLSGLIARERGVYNSFKPLKDRRRFRIDAEQLRSLAEIERYAAGRDEGLLYKYRLTGLLGQYEDYLADRTGFFERIYSGLGLPVALPPPSRYAVMVPDLKAVIANFDEVRAVAEELGERL